MKELAGRVLVVPKLSTTRAALGELRRGIDEHRFHHDGAEPLNAQVSRSPPSRVWTGRGCGRGHGSTG